jgi:polar amino acid transport system substrate-binding protein
VGTVRGTTASLWLSEEQLAKRDYPNIEAAVEALDEDDIDALVYDAPVLRYQRSKVGGDRVRLVGPIFKPEQYGVVLPLGSPMRKQVNEALLELYDDGTYDSLVERWFGAS